MNEDEMLRIKLLEEMLEITKKIQEQSFYMEYAIDNDTLEKLDELIKSRDLFIENYNHCKEKYINYTKKESACNAKESQVLEDIQVVLKQIYEDDLSLNKKMAASYQVAKESVKKIGNAKRATKGYFNTAGIQGINYNNKS